MLKCENYVIRIECIWIVVANDLGDEICVRIIMYKSEALKYLTVDSPSQFPSVHQNIKMCDFGCTGICNCIQQ